MLTLNQIFKYSERLTKQNKMDKIVYDWSCIIYINQHKWKLLSGSNLYIVIWYSLPIA